MGGGLDGVAKVTFLFDVVASGGFSPVGLRLAKIASAAVGCSARRAALGAFGISDGVACSLDSGAMTSLSAKSAGGGIIPGSHVGGNMSEIDCESVGGVQSRLDGWASLGVVVTISVAGISSNGFSGASHSAAHLEVGERRPGVDVCLFLFSARTTFVAAVDISGVLTALAVFGAGIPPSAPAGIGMPRPWFITPRIARAVCRRIGAVLSPAEECRFPSLTCRARVGDSISPVGVVVALPVLAWNLSAAFAQDEARLFVCVIS